jgi:hypothetical protein
MFVTKASYEVSYRTRRLSYSTAVMFFDGGICYSTNVSLFDLCITL